MFIIVINFMHGSGKILFNIGPFYFIVQGLKRGVYYSGIVLELFIMSFLLTEGFDEMQTISALRSLKFWRKDLFGKKEKIDFIFLIFYVFKLFKISYANMKIFFKGRKSNYQEKLKRRIVRFLVNSLKESQKEINRIKDINIPKVNLHRYDMLIITLQFIVVISPLIFSSEELFTI